MGATCLKRGSAGYRRNPKASPTNDEEFERHLKDIQDTYQSKLNALYLLYPEFRPSSADGNGLAESSRGKLSRLVRQAMNKHNQPYTMHDMAQWIAEIDPIFSKTVKNVQLSNTLTRLWRREELEKVPGVIPTAYKKKVA